MKNFDTKNIKSGRSLLPICEVDAPLFLSAVDDKKSISEKTTSRYPQSGRSMIEMLGVLAIIGVLSVGGIAGYSKAMTKYRINKTIEQITLIAGNVRTFFASQKNVKYLGLTDYQILKKAKLVPEEMLSGGVEMENAFGGGFYVADSYINDLSNAYAIAINGLPEEACIELASYDWQSLGNLMAIAIGSGAYSSFGDFYKSLGDFGCEGQTSSPFLGCKNGSVVSLQIPLDQIIDACSTSGELALKFY